MLGLARRMAGWQPLLLDKDRAGRNANERKPVPPALRRLAPIPDPRRPPAVPLRGLRGQFPRGHPRIGAGSGFAPPANPPFLQRSDGRRRWPIGRPHRSVRKVPQPPLKSWPGTIRSILGTVSKRRGPWFFANRGHAVRRHSCHHHDRGDEYGPCGLVLRARCSADWSCLSAATAW